MNKDPLPGIDALLLDLGGVLLHLEPARQLAALEALWGGGYRTFIEGAEGDALYQEFERGRVEPSSFLSGIARGLGKEAPTEEDFNAAFASILGHFLSENIEKVAALRGQTKLYLLSNTNALHAPLFEALFERECEGHGTFREFFDYAHYSHELGERKPDDTAFLALLARHQLTADRVLFIDDNAANIAAAKKLGFRTFHTPMNARLPDLTSLL